MTKDYWNNDLNVK